jgi:hypothetical protein
MRLNRGSSAPAAKHAVKATVKVLQTSAVRHHVARGKPLALGGLVVQELGPAAAVIAADSPAGLFTGIQKVRNFIAIRRQRRLAFP